MTAKSTLIAYYSWKGNTHFVAEYIRRITGGDIFKIEPLMPYPAEHDPCAEQAQREINDGFRPNIIGSVTDIRHYDTVLIGSPNWWNTIAPPVHTFLEHYGRHIRRIAPFCTYGTGGEANLFKDIAKLAPQAVRLKGLAIEGDNVKTELPAVKQWLKDCAIL